MLICLYLNRGRTGAWTSKVALLCKQSKSGGYGYFPEINLQFNIGIVQNRYRFYGKGDYKIP